MRIEEMLKKECEGHETEWVGKILGKEITRQVKIVKIEKGYHSYLVTVAATEDMLASIKGPEFTTRLANLPSLSLYRDSLLKERQTQDLKTVENEVNKVLEAMTA